MEQICNFCHMRRNVDNIAKANRTVGQKRINRTFSVNNVWVNTQNKPLIFIGASQNRMVFITAENYNITSSCTKPLNIYTKINLALNDKYNLMAIVKMGLFQQHRCRMINGLNDTLHHITPFYYMVLSFLCQVPNNIKNKSILG